MTQSFVSEYNPDKPTDQEAQTFTLNCNNVEADMIFLTDLSPGSLGHGISEVNVYKSIFSGKLTTLTHPIERV